MSDSPQLRVSTAVVAGHPDLAEVRFVYGRAGDIGAVRVHVDDFADFIDCLRSGFPDVVVTRLEVPRRQKPKDDGE